MPTPHRAPATLAPLRHLIETLVESADPPTRRRILLESVIGSGVARAAAVWHPARPAGDPAGLQSGRNAAWLPVLSRGPEELLPSAGEVEAVAGGLLAPNLPHRRAVLLAGGTPPSLALALGEVDLDDERVDLVEGLLLTWSAVEAPEISDAPEDLLPPIAGAGGAGRTVDAEGGVESLAHDLRNLLTGIRTTQDVLSALGPDLSRDEADAFACTVERECRRAGELINLTLEGVAPVLGAARGAGSEPTVPAAPADAAVVARDVALSENAQCRAAGLALELRVDPAVGSLAVALSGSALERILRNLLVNAREALLARTAENSGDAGHPLRDEHDRGQALRGTGRIRLELLADPTHHGGLVACVEDDGPGIPAALRRTLFLPGVTSKPAGDAAGHGQGLASVARLLGACGGQIRARNVPAGGARFELWVPAAAA